MSHPEQDFTVSDRRIRFDEPDTAEPSPARAARAPEPTRQAAGPGRPAAGGASDAFLALLEMLAAPALLHLGEAGGAPSGLVGGQRPVNLPAAKEFIEVLTVLETKTQGNLAPAEQTILKDLLFTLKMKYVEASKRTGAAR